MYSIRTESVSFRNSATPFHGGKRLLENAPLDGLDAKAADVWALGATVFWALTGVNAGARIADEAWEQLSGPANNLLRKMLFAEPAYRITVASAQQHKFLRAARARARTHGA